MTLLHTLDQCTDDPAVRLKEALDQLAIDQSLDPYELLFGSQHTISKDKPKQPSSLHGEIMNKPEKHHRPADKYVHSARVVPLVVPLSLMLWSLISALLYHFIFPMLIAGGMLWEDSSSFLNPLDSFFFYLDEGRESFLLLTAYIHIYERATFLHHTGQWFFKLRLLLPPPET
jgi:hypothetical protein